MDPNGARVPPSDLPSHAEKVTFSATGRPLDDVDRRIIVALQHDPRVSWSSIAERIGVAASTVARRGQNLLDDGTVKVSIVPTLGHNGHVQTFIGRISCTPGRQVEVAEKLLNTPEARFVSLVTGKADIVTEVVITGGTGQYARILTEMQSIPGVERWRSDLLMNTSKVSFDWGRQIFPDEAEIFGESREMPPPNSCGPEHFDTVDRQMIEILEREGRASFSSVASAIGLNESNIRRRYERLLAGGCVTPIATVPASALGMIAETFLLVRVKPNRLNAVCIELKQQNCVRFLATSLEDSSVYCEVILPTTEDLYVFMTETLANMEGVQGWSAFQQLVFMKRGYGETGWWRSQIAV